MNSPENMDYRHDGWSLGKPAIGLPSDLIFGTARIFTTRHDSWPSKLPRSSISCLNEGGDRLEKVFSVDEKIAIQTLDRLDPLLTLKHNHRENFTCGCRVTVGRASPQPEGHRALIAEASGCAQS